MPCTSTVSTFTPAFRGAELQAAIARVCRAPVPGARRIVEGGCVGVVGAQVVDGELELEHRSVCLGRGQNEGHTLCRSGDGIIDDDRPSVVDPDDRVRATPLRHARGEIQERVNASSLAVALVVPRSARKRIFGLCGKPSEALVRPAGGKVERRAEGHLLAAVAAPKAVRLAPVIGLHAVLSRLRIARAMGVGRPQMLHV
eukprot:scaffold39571_cov70-Phaeocystis_antarctica.AAC.8